LRATFSDVIIGLKKLCESKTTSQSAKTKSQYLNDIAFNLKNLSVEQLLKIAQAQSIESRLDKELKRKHRQELLEQVLPNMEEIRRLKELILAKNRSFKDDNRSIMSVTISQQSPLNSCMLSEVDGNNMNGDVGAANVTDAPLSLEFTP